MENPKLGTGPILWLQFIILGAGRVQSKVAFDPLRVCTRVFRIIKCSCKMDAAPSFGVSMDIFEAPSNPYLS